MRLLTSVAFALFVLSSCQKDLVTGEESLNGEMVSNDVGGPGEFSNCKLRRIVHEHGGVTGLLVNGLITYNSAGNPISITYGSQTGTGNPNHYFFYDKKNRLTEWREAYSPHPDDVVEATRHKYGYNDAGILIVDSALHFGYGKEDGQGSFHDTTIIHLTYDSQGRIIREDAQSLRGGRRFYTFTYDNRGNLGVLGWKSSSYDYKVSFFRSHPVFQFICRNYSRNNASRQAKYNSKGLPLSMVPGNDRFFNAHPAGSASSVVNGGIIKAIYDCQ